MTELEQMQQQRVRDIHDLQKKFHPYWVYYAESCFADPDEVPELRFHPYGATAFHLREGYVEVAADSFAGYLPAGETLQEQDQELKDLVFIWTKYLLRHEFQHAKSTTEKAWKFGLEEGFRTVMETLSEKLEGRKRNMVREKQFEQFCEDMRRKGYYLSTELVRTMVRFVQNSLEDGRIELLILSSDPGFREILSYCRGTVWNRTPYEQTDLSNPAEKLRVYLNQILSLATTGAFEKNFFDLAPDADYGFLESLSGLVNEARLAPVCRDCMETGIQILEKLAQLCVRAAADEDAMRQLTEELGEKNGKTGAEAMDPSTPEANEEFRTGSFQTEGGNGTGGDKDGNGGTEGSKEESKGDAGGNTDGIIFVPADCSEAEIREQLEQLYESLSEAAERAMKGEERRQSSLSAPADKTGLNRPLTLSDVKDLIGDSIPFEEVVHPAKPGECLPVRLQREAEVLKGEVRRYLVNRRKRKEKRKKSGTLDTGRLVRLACRQTDVFCHRSVKEDSYHAAAYLLCDNSGSMGNGWKSKRYYALSACAKMEKVFASLIPLKVTAYSFSGFGIRHERLKDWRQELPHTGSWSFYTGSCSRGGNADAESIKIAGYELLVRSERQKLLVILSDGIPSGTSLQATKDAIREIRMHGIRVIGIFVDDEDEPDEDARRSFEALYEGKDCITSRPEALDEQFTRIMRDLYRSF